MLLRPSEGIQELSGTIREGCEEPPSAGIVLRCKVWPSLQPHTASCYHLGPSRRPRPQKQKDGVHLVTTDAELEGSAVQGRARPLLVPFPSEMLLGHSARISCPASFRSPGQPEAERVRCWGTTQSSGCRLTSNTDLRRVSTHSLLSPGPVAAGRPPRSPPWAAL